ncbi:MAG: mismatch repair protein MutT [Caulobacter sp.]|nr:mismatch repair protein MutT [Caulobacter sp.]
MPWRRRLEPILRPLYRYRARRVRGMTLGVRGLVVNDQGQVLLIEHTYMPGWYMPGGGVEKGETCEQSVIRELHEEAGIHVEGRPVLVSVHSNHLRFPGDHVLIYRIDAWTQTEPTQKGEILQIGWFAPDALPEDVTPSTRKRILEALAGHEPHPLW